MPRKARPSASARPSGRASSRAGRSPTWSARSGAPARLSIATGSSRSSRRGAEAMVRTAVTHTSAAAHQEVYRSFGADVVTGGRSGSRDADSWIHPKLRASRDGKVYPVGSGPRPPVHVNCRSTTAPVLKGHAADRAPDLRGLVRQAAGGRAGRHSRASPRASCTARAAYRWIGSPTTRAGP